MPALVSGGGMAARSRAVSLAVIGAIAALMAAIIALASSWPIPAVGGGVTLGPKLSVTFGLRLSTA